MGTFLLLAEGTSDKVLIHIIRWVLGSNWTGELANFSRLPLPPKTLSQKLELLPRFYETPDVLFYHKDSDGIGYQERKNQVDDALRDVQSLTPIIPIIPERMTEAWFLFNESAIRHAVHNPRGRTSLNIPNTWDSIPDPKAILYQAFRLASGCTGRDLRKISPNILLHQLAEDINDYSPLRLLQSFRAFENDCTHLRQPSPTLNATIEHGCV